MQLLGEFTVENGLLISDPCYKFDDKHEKVQKNIVSEKILKGQWCLYGYQDRRELICCEKSQNPFSANWIYGSSNIAVDSGQAGVFDDEYYRIDDVVGDNKLMAGIDIDESGDKWYAMCCHVTTTSNTYGAGVIPYGCVSGTAFGDGIYDYYYLENNKKKVCGIKIVFADEDELDDD